ncbi:L,D-transpeptidase [Thiosulfatimonas sediminis]|nr:L,D-transpeptidase [Thiosulfatimonas sediminis]
MLQCLIASIADQRLYLCSLNPDTQQQTLQSWPISSAKKGIGNLKNSNQTPLGWHLIRAKIGAEMPIYSVFKARRATAELCDLASADPQRDWILSRILWLSGMQKGINRLGNCDSMQRFIYIHGTNQEDLLGKPVSHGCLRMKNTHLLSLFDQLNIGCPLLISVAPIRSVLAPIVTQVASVGSNYIKQKNELNQIFNNDSLSRFMALLEVSC